MKYVNEIISDYHISLRVVELEAWRTVINTTAVALQDLGHEGLSSGLWHIQSEIYKTLELEKHYKEDAPPLKD